MKNALFAVIALVVIGGGAWYYLTQDRSLSDEEVAAVLAARADEINTGDGIRFDDFSRLDSATAVERQITIRGTSLLEAAAIDDTYLDSRRMQAGNQLCRDEVIRPAMEAGATHVFNWFSADDESLGMVTLRGAEICAEMGL